MRRNRDTFWPPGNPGAAVSNTYVNLTQRAAGSNIISTTSTIVTTTDHGSPALTA